MNDTNWRNWTLAERERQYSPSSCVAAMEPFLEAYVARSRDAQTRFRCQENLLWARGQMKHSIISPQPPPRHLCWFISTEVTGKNTPRRNRFLRRRIALRMELRSRQSITLWHRGRG